MSREQLLELEEVKRGLLRQAYRMKQECPHMSPVGLESEMYAAIMAEVREITSRIQRSAEIDRNKSQKRLLFFLTKKFDKKR